MPKAHDSDNRDAADRLIQTFARRVYWISAGLCGFRFWVDTGRGDTWQVRRRGTLYECVRVYTDFTVSRAIMQPWRTGHPSRTPVKDYPGGMKNLFIACEYIFIEQLNYIPHLTAFHTWLLKMEQQNRHPEEVWEEGPWPARVVDMSWESRK
jgi:hypothetical protein